MFGCFVKFIEQLLLRTVPCHCDPFYNLFYFICCDGTNKW